MERFVVFRREEPRLPFFLMGAISLRWAVRQCDCERMLLPGLQFMIHLELGSVNCQGRTETCGGQAMFTVGCLEQWSVSRVLFPKRRKGIDVQDVRMHWC